MSKILILIAVNLIVYFRLLRYEYIIDDQLVPKGKGRNIFETLIFQLHALKYSNKEVEHLLRILVHTAVSVMIYLAFGRSEISFVAALLFSVNPSNNQGVCWLNGIGYSMSALCVLLMVAAPAWSILPYLYTLAWHVTAVFAPILFLAKGPWYMVFLLVPYIGIGWALSWKIPVLKAQKNATLDVRVKSPNAPMRMITPRKLVFVIKCYGYYFFMSLLPRRLGLYHTFGYSYGLAKRDTTKWESISPLFWSSLALILANVAIMVHYWGTPLAYGIFWYSLFIGQFCNFIMIQQPIAERYLYLPNVGLMYALAWVMFQTGYAYTIAAIFLTAYLSKLIYFMPAYKNMQSYVDYSLQDFPDQFALHNWQGVLHRDKNRLFSSMAAWALGLRYRDYDFRLNFNMAHCLGAMGFYKESLKYYEKAGEGLAEEDAKEEHRKILADARAIIEGRLRKAEGGDPRIIRV